MRSRGEITMDDSLSPKLRALVNDNMIRAKDMYTSENREAYVRWYMDQMIAANLQIAAERWAGSVFQGPRTMKDIIQQPGPAGLCPDESTLWRWLKSEWAAPIIADVVTRANQAIDISTDAVWPLVIQAQQMLAISGKGRDSTGAAKFLADQRKKGVVDTGNPLGRVIADLVGSGRYDATITVKEQLEIRLRKIRESQTTTPDSETIDGTARKVA